MSLTSQFVRDFMSGSKYAFFQVGDSIVTGLGNGNVAKISLVSSKVHDNFDCVRVKIINTNNVVGESEVFRFGDLDVIVNTQNASSGLAKQNGLHAWKDRNQIDWFINKPSQQSVEKMRNNIDTYITIFSHAEVE